MSTAASAERDAVLSVYDGTMAARSVWHVVDSEWLHQWAAYVGIDLSTRQPVQPSATAPPSTIPNERLRDAAYPTLEVLRPHLLEGSDYELVPHSVAELLFQRYGTDATPRFARSVIEVGTLAKEQRVDIRPAVLTLVPLLDSGEEREADVEVCTYASNTKWSDIRDMLLNAEKGSDIYDEVPHGTDSTQAQAQHSERVDSGWRKHKKVRCIRRCLCRRYKLPRDKQHHTAAAKHSRTCPRTATQHYPP